MSEPSEVGNGVWFARRILVCGASFEMSRTQRRFDTLSLTTGGRRCPSCRTGHWL